MSNEIQEKLEAAEHEIQKICSGMGVTIEQSDGGVAIVCVEFCSDESHEKHERHVIFVPF